ncbi:MAG: Na(+)/H(+) antiporter subunit F [bacterium]|nr:Na(+)/H(+) antiporter subunit F [bacterium]MCK6559965.1 cation:proton antiporter [bacterium]NUM68791.1 cation:proton antiporter [candidate division KSB1 bacterium]
MNLLNITLMAAIPLLTLTVVFAFIRLVRGPGLPDRVVALDLIFTIGIGIIAVYAILTNQPAFLDVAIIAALIAFWGTIAFTYYLKRRAHE